MADLEREYLGSGHRVEKMKDRQEGYDVRVCAANGMVIQYVEVKTKSGFWDLRGVWISPAQFRQAREQEDKFTLAVVEHVYEAEATIFYVDDPASDIARFCFDYGWAERANRTVSVPGALKGPASSTESADEDALSRLVRAVVDAGLPEPDAPWKDGEVELAAAWADMRVGIRAEDGDPLSEPDSWQIRQASQWTTDEIIDAVRDGL
jgi:hypothetical protein